MEQGAPMPSANTRHAVRKTFACPRFASQTKKKTLCFQGYLLKLGETHKTWKRRWISIDSETGWMYWWSKPDGKVVGAIPLFPQTVVTSLPAPESSFRIAFVTRGLGKCLFLVHLLNEVT
jgi:hypothetical protein